MSTAESNIESTDTKEYCVREKEIANQMLDLIKRVIKDETSSETVKNCIEAYQLFIFSTAHRGNNHLFE